MAGFVAFDFETANERRGSPCSFGYAVVDCGEIHDAGSFLIRPPEFRFAGFNVSLHGIRPEMCLSAPEWTEALPRLVSIIGDHLAVAHFASFDIGVIRDTCLEVDIPWPSLRVACTRAISRVVWPELGSYSLPDVVRAAGLAEFQHHDAAADARSAAGIALAAVAIRRAADLDDLLRSLPLYPATLSPGTYVAGKGPGHIHHVPTAGSPGAVVDPLHPFFGRKVAFTGGLWSMPREQAWQAVVDVGGRPVTSVSKLTDFVVVGGEFHGLLTGHEFSSKLGKALALRREGRPLELLDEHDFLSVLRGGA